MKRINFIWDEIVYGGHWFSLSVVAFVLTIIVLLELNLRWELLAIVYLLLQAVYNYNHYKEADIDSLLNSDRTKHIKIYYKILPILTIFYGIVFIILILYYGNIESLVIAGFLLLSGLLFTKLFKKLTKIILGFKTFYASFTLALLILFIALFYSYPINFLILELVIFFFLRFLISSSFSDIKDIDIDKKHHLLTWPVYFGKKKILTFLHMLNFVTIIPLFIIIFSIHPPFSFFVLFSYLYCFFYIEKAKKRGLDIHSLTNIIVDGEFFFWPFFLFIALILSHIF